MAIGFHSAQIIASQTRALAFLQSHSWLQYPAGLDNLSAKPRPAIILEVSSKVGDKTKHTVRDKSRDNL
jgi:hypothetical protein